MTALDVLTITDPATGAKARIAPGMGFNCFSFTAPAPAAAAIELLWAAPEFAAGTAKPSGSGIPLLFPFAGRIRGASYRFDGKTYALAAGDGLGNAIHGFVIGRPWRVVHQSADRAMGQFQTSVDDAAIVDHWPADFRITADYHFAGGALACDYTIENPDTKPLPFGFGTHPYFRVPLGGRDAADCRVQVPIGDQWDLQELLPTGHRATPPLIAELAAGMPMSAMRLDHVFSNVRFDNHRASASVHDPQSRRTLVMTFDDQFAACVVYNPPHREAVCIEPYTTIPDPFTLADRGIDPHLRILQPGKSFRTRIEIRLDGPAS